MTSRITPRTWALGDYITAALMNAQLRDNLNALWPYTTKGDLAVALSSTGLDRLPVGANGQILTPDSNQALGIKWAGASCCSASRSNASSVNNGVSTQLTLVTEDFDTDGFYPGGGNVITIPTGLDGIYLVGGQGYWQSSATPNTQRAICLYINTTYYYSSTVQDADGSAVWVSISRLVSLSAGSTIDLRGLQMSGGDLGFYAAQLWCARMR
jgi:hypothetical protein